MKTVRDDCFGSVDTRTSAFQGQELASLLRDRLRDAHLSVLNESLPDEIARLLAHLTEGDAKHEFGSAPRD